MYGWIYLVAGVMAFVIRGSSEYYRGEDDEDEDYNEYDDESDDEEEEERDKDDFGERAIKSGNREALQEFSYGGRRKERASRIKLDREEHSLSGESVSKISDPLRIRSSKVCPACGASVGIEHKFCHTCGSPLQGTRAVDPVPDLLTESAPTLQESPSAFKEFQMVSPIGAPEPAEEDDWWRADGEGGGDVEKNKDIKSADYNNNYDEDHEKEDQEAMPHRVFVKPAKEEDMESRLPYMVNPDNSYQEFSNYTRRRKRRRNSLARRVLGPLILLLAVAGAAWLLFGVRRVPEPVKPVEPPPPITRPDPEPPEPIPVSIWDLIQMENPTRGIVTGSNVNVRPDHAATGQVVTRLNAGTRAEILERWEGVSGTLSGPWFNIRSDGRTGWIYGQYFQPLDGRQATLPRGYTAALLNSFGSDKTELTEQLRQPTRQTATTMTWTGLTVELRGDNNVVRLQVTGAQHVLQNELAVGMTEEALYRKVGYPSDYRSATSLLRYVEIGSEGAEQGMAVRMQNGKVQSITVGNI